MSGIRFDSRVALITGAGKGLGRAYALLLAERGARVVVNNRKREPAGEPGSADQVVAEIESAGGTAAANYDSVEATGAGQRMVEQALDTYGRLDILINNAGVDQHVPLHRMDDADIERIFSINFFGTLNATRAALPTMREAGYGRILFSTSSAGLYGLHGLAIYAASKGAIVALMRSVAQEGAGRGITANAVAPYALTQMTAGHLDGLPPDRLDPALVAPVAAWLVDESCGVTGETFIVGYGQLRRAEMVENDGIAFGEGEAITPEAVADRAEAIRDMSRTHPQPDALASFMAVAPRTGPGG